MTTVTAPAGIRHAIVSAPVSRAGQTPTARLRLTVRGRRVLAVLAATPAALGLGLAIVAGGSAIAARDDAAPSTAFEMVTVTSGDTLWSLAQDVAPAADPRDVVDAIARLNALDGVTITPGQRLAIPAEYATD
ncbi:LysM peptidoglycan-binding domain-containing protein [Micromonospora sp. DT81.3]|uniref:LysM peptidoglycan-binding domain-containing protein n=1 Tax=Actinomycetes TaxID=1760 RepID=UPI003CEA389D